MSFLDAFLSSFHMVGQDTQDNVVVILSDDDEEENEEKYIINKNGKRVYYYDSEEESQDEDENPYYIDDFAGEDYEEDESDPYFSDEEEEQEDRVKLSQELPEGHKSAIVSERDYKNPLQPLGDAFTKLKTLGLSLDLSKDIDEIKFAMGSFMNNSPSVALNIEGVVGPIAFPMNYGDLNLIMSAYPEEEDKNDSSSFKLKTSHIILNQSFQTYVYGDILRDIYRRLGVDEQVISRSRMEAIQLNICGYGRKLELPKVHPRGSYASVLIMLPQGFDGGETEARYGEKTLTFRPDIKSYVNSFYMAWYNDVEIVSKPITDKCQVSLYFSLIYNSSDEDTDECFSILEERRKSKARFEAEEEMSPELAARSKPILNTITKYLRVILKKNNKYPLLYMLNYSYNSRSLKVCDLKKSDRTVVKLIIKAAEEAGYSAYITLVSRDVQASVGDVGFSMREVDEEGVYLSKKIIRDTLALTTLYDLNGVDQLNSTVFVSLKDYHPIIQGKLWYSGCKPDSQKYNRSYRTGKPSVTYFYFNTAIALIPKSNNSFLKKPSIITELCGESIHEDK